MEIIHRGFTEMVTFEEMKKKLKQAAERDRINIIRGEKNQILLDLNNDKLPEAALIDTTDSGTPDLLAIDATGDHKFNLYLDDTDDNDYPDVVYVDRKGDGNVQLVTTGEETKDVIQKKLYKVFSVLTADEADADSLNKALHELADLVKLIQIRVKSRKK